jgi:hypothetical protein
MLRYLFPLKPSHPRFRKRDFKSIRTVAFMMFIVFVAYKILTPPSIEVARVQSPDGTKTARLRKFYYVSQPSYKIYYRDVNRRLWLNLLYLPSYTNIPHATAVEALQWSSDSEHLSFMINGTSIWDHTFE